MNRTLALVVVNTLTMLRYVLAGYAIVYWAHGSYETSAIFITAGIVTDWLDGPLARYWQVTTKIGFLFDMIGDRVLFLAPFAGEACLGNLSWIIFFCLAAGFGITDYIYIKRRHKLLPSAYWIGILAWAMYLAWQHTSITFMLATSGILACCAPLLIVRAKQLAAQETTTDKNGSTQNSDDAIENAIVEAAIE